tara:strand:+ start:21 stop:1127 length:1107 start_codon:yes stop_codon:yes gene_type:complete
VYKYLKYYLSPALAPFIILGLLLGGSYMWLGFFVLLLLFTIGDAFLSEDTKKPKYKYPFLVEIPLYLALPILILILVIFAWTTGSNDFDLFNIGLLLSYFFEYDFIGARNYNNFIHYLGGLLSVAFTIAGIGTNTGHELTHRTNKKIDVLFGRWMFSMSCNADFSIEHVYGHHVNVCTDKDPASARKGENVYNFFLRSTLHGHLSAWEIESRRLKVKKQNILSFNNQMLTGYLMSMVWFCLFYYGGGLTGLLLFILQALIAKFILEVVNYFEHYGLRRTPGHRVQPYHSWNTNKRLSSMFLFSLTRHSAHHEKPREKFWNLSPYQDAPQLPYGYFTSLLVCLIPSIWKKSIHPLLDEWDSKYSKSPTI